MNLDLNLGPLAPRTPSVGLGTEGSSEESVGVDRWRPSSYMSAREALIRRATRQLCRWRRVQLSSDARLGDSDGNGSDPIVSFGDDIEDGGGTSQVGEGSVVAEERNSEVLNMCDNDVTLLESGSIDEKKYVEESRVEGESFFDCNICLDLSREPVVTCCGHLFCWSCIYQWLQIHSNAKECPVCKGEVILKNVTPIYGRGGGHTLDPEEDSGIQIPARPSSRRVESVRQTIRRTAEMSSSLFPIEEIIRHIIPDGSDDRDSNSNSSSRASILNRRMTTRARQREQREQASVIPLDDVVDLGLTGASIPNRIMTTRARQREQASVVPQDDIVDLGPTRASIPNIIMRSNDVVDLTQDEPIEIPRSLPPLIYRRERSSRSGSNDNRDSIRRMGGVIFEENQTVDTGVESDSLVSLSTSSSRRSEVDSGNPRALRRRRLD